MQIPRPAAEDKQRFRALVPDQPGVEVKPMFGNLGAFVNGHMFMGLFGAEIGLKLDPSTQDLVRAAGGGDFGPAERPMSGYVTLPAAAMEEEVTEWIRAAFALASALEPKAPKTRA